MAKNEVSASIAAIDAFVAVLLEKISEGKRVICLQKGKRIFSQGDHADAIYADASILFRVAERRLAFFAISFSITVRNGSPVFS
jgi:phosphoheptose isomerase